MSEELREVKIKLGVECEADGVMKIIMTALDIYEDLGVPLVITSLTDGTHMENSKHYSGEAVDLRTFYFTKAIAEDVTWQLQVELGNNYDVIFEGDHIHCEYDPE